MFSKVHTIQLCFSVLIILHKIIELYIKAAQYFRNRQQVTFGLSTHLNLFHTCIQFQVSCFHCCCCLVLLTTHNVQRKGCTKLLFCCCFECWQSSQSPLTHFPLIANQEQYFQILQLVILAPVMFWILNVPPKSHVLKAYQSVVLLAGGGTFRKWSLTGGSQVLRGRPLRGTLEPWHLLSFCFPAAMK